MFQDITNQIESLTLHPGRALVICDVDEVVVHFVRALETYLAAAGYWLDTSTFALNGNVKRLDDDEPATVECLGELLHDFFGAQTGGLDTIDGAVDTLNAISRQAAVVFLTNLPMQFAAARRRNLISHGLDAPVLVNFGPKGPAVRQLTEKTQGTCVFIDDAPSNIDSVLDHAPDVHVIHFINDARFDDILDPIAGVALRTRCWRETGDFLHRLLGTI